VVGSIATAPHSTVTATATGSVDNAVGIPADDAVAIPADETVGISVDNAVTIPADDAPSICRPPTDARGLSVGSLSRLTFGDLDD